MQDYWASFARSVEPGGTDRQRWPDFDSDVQDQFRFTEDGIVTQVGEPPERAV
jgi:carboxylesterase type B